MSRLCTARWWSSTASNSPVTSDQPTPWCSGQQTFRAGTAQRVAFPVHPLWAVQLTHTLTRRRSSVTSLPTIDVHENAYLRGRREVCLIPDRQARPPAAVCCMAPQCGLHALQFWLVPISHIRSTAQETCIVIDYENKNSRDMPVRIGPSQTLGPCSGCLWKTRALAALANHSTNQRGG